MHGTKSYLTELHFGFSADQFHLRVDPAPGDLDPLRDFEFRVLLEGAEELRIAVRIEDFQVKDCVVERGVECRDRAVPGEAVSVAFKKILEVSAARSVVPLAGPRIRLSVALWHGALPLDVLPAEGKLEIELGEENFGW